MKPSDPVPDSPSVRDPVEALAEDFLERYRRGERPALTEFTERAPAHADEIRELFPALVLMERASPDATAPPTERSPAVPLERLGEYRIIREVGRGGMGIVYEAEQEALGRRVALKVMPPASSGDTRCLLRFRREARSAARLHHTNIVPVFDVGERDGVHFYAMQFIQGQGLDEVIAELHRLRSAAGNGASPTPTRRGAEAVPSAAADLAGNMFTGEFQCDEPPSARPTHDESHSPRSRSPAESGKSTPRSGSALTGLTDRSEHSTKSGFHYYHSVARIGLQVANALAYAHGQRVLHRDIKPSNLLLDAGGTVWVTDFGLAKEEGDDLTRTGDIVGTLRYMAPERLNSISDARSDIYSLGLTIYELLTLRPAFAETDRAQLVQRIAHQDPTSPRKRDPHVPRDLETIVLKAIAKEPARRYGSAEDMEEDLRRFLADRPIRARRTSTRERVWRWCRRNRGWAATIATVLGLLVVSALGGTILSIYLQRALNDARRADEEKTEKLREAHLERARALRSSGRVGQRFEALKAIREAAKIRITPELRDEAVAALVLPDVEVAREWEGHPEDTTEWTSDAKCERYARISKSGVITVCRLTDAGEEVIFRIPKQEGDGRTSWGLRMSPDGRFLVHGHSSPRQSFAGGVRVWRLDGPSPVVHFNEPEGLHLFALTFDAGGRRLALGHANGTVSIYDLEQGKRTQRLLLAAWPNALAFHPRGDRLAIACPSNVRVFDIEAERESQPPLSDPKVKDWTYSLAWHPAGRLLAATTFGSKVHLWDTETAIQVMPPLEGHATSLTFNATGDRLLSADWSGMFRMWDGITGRLLLAAPGRFETSGEIPHLQLSADGTRMGMERYGTKLRLWRLVDGRELRTIRRAGADREETLLTPVLDADGRFLAASSNRGLGFFDLESGKELAFVRFENDNIAGPRRFDRSSGWLTGGNRGGMLWPARWDISRSTLHLGPPQTLAWSRDSGLDTSLDGRIRAFPQGVRTRVMDRDRPGWSVDLGPQQDVRQCAVSPDGRWVATCTWHPDPKVLGAGVRIWEIQGEQSRHVTDLSLEAPAYASFSPNGRWLATLSVGIRVQVWEVETWRELRSYKTIACWSPDGQLLATHDRMGEILFVEPDTGKEVLRLIGPQASIYIAACMTPDGTRLIATLGDGTGGLQVWDLRLIRKQLRELLMDWDLPEFREAPSPENRAQLPAVVLDPGRFRQPAFGSWSLDAAVYSLQLALQPLNPPALYSRALAYGRLNDHPRCMADCEAYFALVPRDDDRRPHIERCYAEACNDQAWDWVVKSSPRRDLAEAGLRLARTAVGLTPDSFLHQNTLGVALYRTGQHQDAVRCLEANLQRSREFIAFDLYFLAMSHHRLGQPAKARECFDRANASVAAEVGLSAGHRLELAAFRAEAEQVLGIAK